MAVDDPATDDDLFDADFDLADPEAVTWAGGQVTAPRPCEAMFPDPPA